MRVCRSWPGLQLSCVKDSRGLAPGRPVQRAEQRAELWSSRAGHKHESPAGAGELSGEAICCYNNDTTGSHSPLSGALSSAQSSVVGRVDSSAQNSTISPPSPRSKKVISELGSAERQARVCFCLDFQHPSCSLLTLRWSDISYHEDRHMTDAIWEKYYLSINLH